ncbi:MAG TPA: elongation factor G [Candidatus Polarisedimenticolia bacterium]|nr:elongation factor G [Candidatus Polarisedimenticolia bacterium]
MKLYEIADIRNLGIIGHGASGKTSLTSSLLYSSGTVNRLGRVDQGTTVTDFDEEEIARKVSISSALCYLEWKKTKINIVDTPGYGAFIADAKAVLRVLDGALVVVDGVAGVEVQTEEAWGYAGEFDLPRLLVVNKLDRENSSFARALESIGRAFGRQAVPIQIPLGAEKTFTGVVDLVANKATVYERDDSGKNRVTDVPPDLADAVKEARESLMEMVAEVDDGLMEKFFESGSLTQEELVKGLARGVKEKKIFPVLCASALANIGAHPLLDACVAFLPHPDERGPFRGDNPRTKAPAERRGTFDEPHSAFVFKTIADPYSGKISLFRVYSGSLKSDSTVYNATRDVQERFGSILILQGKESQPVTEVRAGDIAAVPKLKETSTGDTLADKAQPIVYPAVSFPEPSIAFALQPKSRADEEKISSVLPRLVEEDPTIRFRRDGQTHELIIAGNSDQHVEVTLARMKKKFGVEAILHAPKVPYFETIKKKAEAQGKHKKQTGGHGQYGDCWIRLEPMARGAGFEFKDEIFGGAIPKNFIPSVEKGIQDARMLGFLAGYPVVDFRVVLFDGSYHDVDSSDIAFKIAGSLGFKKAMEEASPTLLEPIMEVEVTAPGQFMGDLMGDLNSRRGRVLGVEANGHNEVIKANVPMAEMLTYASILKSITGGRGSYRMKMSRYEEVPAHLQTKIVAAHKAAREGSGAHAPH